VNGKKLSKTRKKVTKESFLEVPETGSANITRNFEEANELPRKTQTPMEHARQASKLKAMAATPAKESPASVNGTQIGLYRLFLIPVLLKLLPDTKAKETQSTAGDLPVPGNSFDPFPR